MIKKIRHHAFTLIELLVVIAIIAILAAILFPVFARARDKARQSTCLSNAKQIGTAVTMYTQDYDETFYFQREWHEVDDVGNGYITYIRWPSRHMPYIKNDQVFSCPSDRQPGNGRNYAATCCPGVQPGTSNGCGCVPFKRGGFGANLVFTDGSQGRGRPTALSTVANPAQKIFIAEAQQVYGCCEPWNVEYFRGANYNGAGFPDFATFRAQVGHAIRDGFANKMEFVTRHNLGNVVTFADGHAKWVRWDKVGDSDSCEWWEAIIPDYTIAPQFGSTAVNGRQNFPPFGGCTVMGQPRL